MRTCEGGARRRAEGGGVEQRLAQAAVRVGWRVDICTPGEGAWRAC